MHSASTISKLDAWLLAVRPRTLPAAVGPVLVGTALAAAHGRFDPPAALVALLVALFLQISVNLANDYFDFQKGVDTPDRTGPLRVTQSGLISPQGVQAGMAVSILISMALGLYLVVVGGVPVLVAGLAALLATLAYSGGPFPLASHGLGDLFVFIFFGPVAVVGTYYVQALSLAPSAMAMAVPVGLLITAILVVNNLRDIPTDRTTGKRTLAVRLGEGGTRLEYAALVAAAYAVPFLLWASGGYTAWILLPFGSLPEAVRVARAVWTSAGSPLNRALAGTARLSLVYSLLLALGILLAR